MPVQVRDAALKIKDDIPRSAVNKEYFTQIAEKQVLFLKLNSSSFYWIYQHVYLFFFHFKLAEDNTVAYGDLGKITSKNEMLGKLQRKAPYYKRNRPHVCSFWVKGECKRGEECPYR